MDKLMMPKNKAKEFHICICQTCEDHPEISWNDFMEHCQQKHGVTKNSEGKKEMLMHLDGSDFYEWWYNCKFDDKVVFTEIQRSKRTREDLRIWSEK